VPVVVPPNTQVHCTGSQVAPKNSQPKLPQSHPLLVPVVLVLVAGW
jgi:hypothetical protein